MTQAMDHRIATPWYRRRAVMAGASLAALLAAGSAAAVVIAGASKPSYRAPLANTEISAVTTGAFHDVTPLRAKVTPREVVYLDAVEGGRVETVFVRNGDVVAKGQPLVRFQNTALELDVLDREGRLVESITQLQSYAKQLEDVRVANAKASADIDYNITRLSRDLARNETLLAKAVVSPAARDTVRDELDYNRKLRPLQTDATQRQDALRDSELPRVKSELATLNESLRITRAKLDELTVRAPVAGRLTDIDIYAGQMRPRGDRLGQITAASGGMKLLGQVDEFYLGRVKPGQTATLDGTSGASRARVTRVDPQVKNGTFTVELEFDGAEPAGLLSGQALDGHLSLGGDSKATLLPAASYLEVTGGDWVMVVDASGKHAERRRIRIGRRNADQVEILAGLKPGERVITSDYRAFEKVERVDFKQ
jgi:HlyD family secretion protein